jgi:hypothetical protein
MFTPEIILSWNDHARAPPLSSLDRAAGRVGSHRSNRQHDFRLTQSAVSRQIKILEQQLEVELFIRERQTICLTAGAGDAYAREVRDAFLRISAASFIFAPIRAAEHSISRSC